MELVRVVDGVAYVNDSKATNVDATVKSLASIDGPVIVILGGRDKEGDFGSLVPYLKSTRRAVLIGEARARDREGARRSRARSRDAADMADAVRIARATARPGDTVLLAPACASFDMFKNYQERGEVFRASVNCSVGGNAMTTRTPRPTTARLRGSSCCAWAWTRAFSSSRCSLMAMGVSLVLSSSSFFAGGKFGDQFALMRNHAARCVVALVVMFLASRVDYRVYRRAAPMLLLVGILLMLGVFVFGVTIRDTRRWYLLPLIHTTLQPSEIARLALVFFLAYWVTRTGRDFRSFRRGFVPAAAAIALVRGYHCDDAELRDRGGDDR